MPVGENEMVRQIREELRVMDIDIMVLRLLRDVFTQLTIHTGGDIRPQESWPLCRAGSHPYFIFAIPRCGSTFFSDILGNTKMLGFPREHLLFDLLPVFFHTDLTFKEWIRSLSNYSYTSNGYSGTKIISHLFLEIVNHYQDQGRQEMMEELAAYFRQYPVIYLKRMNRVRQAVSLIIARKTAVWHVKNNKKVVSEKSDASLTEDPKEIELAVKWFFDQEQKLESFFRDAGVTPKVYFYEDFANPSRQEHIFRKVFSFLGVNHEEKIPEPSYSALSDELNDAIVASYYRYLEEKLKGDLSLPHSPEMLILSSVVAEINQTKITNPKPEEETKAKSKKWWKFGTSSH
jgi:LPS sulfotransferase NodH